MAWIPRSLFAGFWAVTLNAAKGLTVLAEETATRGGLFDQGETAMHTVYTDILGIATMAVVVCATVCLFLMYFSKNGRTVDESRAWLKRIVVCWLALMLMGAIATYFQSIVAQNDFQI